eukprot:SAG22_NODE_1081_length_5654_cov_4.719352_4_plen_105_part_00
MAGEQKNIYEGGLDPAAAAAAPVAATAPVMAAPAPVPQPQMVMQQPQMVMQQPQMVMAPQVQTTTTVVNIQGGGAAARTFSLPRPSSSCPPAPQNELECTAISI